MKKLNVLYWIFNGLFAAMMLMSAIPDILMDPVAVQGMHDGLGYPLYFLTILGVWKILCVVVILIRGFSLLKEWAYAGWFLFPPSHSLTVRYQSIAFPMQARLWRSNR